ncbi:aberrant root formation protein [Medicago truncatula]|uniref:Aberrant root formation protein n=1 Tax=Medicago truncatula TaxID=3880 RepID=A0A072VDL7_MEDTR|nr:aberrant root formation protein [Medicago truncatula]
MMMLQGRSSDLCLVYMSCSAWLLFQLVLVTTYDVEVVASAVFGENKDDYMDCLSHIKHGCALSVICGHVSEEVAHAAKEDMTVVKDELRNNQIKRSQAIGTLKHVLSFVSLPWELKKHTINFLLCITDGDIHGNCDDEQSQWSSYMPNLFSALQVLADIPISQSLDILIALITNTDSSSMIAILVDLVRREMHTEISSSTSVVKDVQHIDISFWTPSVLELVESILRPPQGGPPSLPEQSDAVLSALNLYRFVIMTESTGKTNYTGVLSRSSLNKVYNEWLLPLRTLVTGIMEENKSDYDELAIDTLCTLNPLELVLYRCIELVEEKLKQVT